MLEHAMDRGHINPGLAVRGIPLIVELEPPSPGEPRQCSFHNPALGQNDEPVLGGRLGHHVDRDPVLRPGHIAVGQATLAAVYPASRNPRAFRELLDEGLEAWRVKEVWIPTWNKGDFWVDIGSTVDRKLAALRRHESQVKNWPDWEKNFRDRMKQMGEKSGYEYAEAFKRIKIG